MFQFTPMFTIHRGLFCTIRCGLGGAVPRLHFQLKTPGWILGPRREDKYHLIIFKYQFVTMTNRKIVEDWFCRVVYRN